MPRRSPWHVCPFGPTASRPSHARRATSGASSRRRTRLRRWRSRHGRRSGPSAPLEGVLLDAVAVAARRRRGRAQAQAIPAVEVDTGTLSQPQLLGMRCCCYWAEVGSGATQRAQRTPCSAEIGISALVRHRLHVALPIRRCLLGSQVGLVPAVVWLYGERRGRRGRRAVGSHAVIHQRLPQSRRLPQRRTRGPQANPARPARLDRRSWRSTARPSAAQRGPARRSAPR